MFSKKILKNQTICTYTQESISLWKDELETSIENIKTTSSSEKLLLLV